MVGMMWTMKHGLDFFSILTLRFIWFFSGIIEIYVLNSIQKSFNFCPLTISLSNILIFDRNKYEVIWSDNEIVTCQILKLFMWFQKRSQMSQTIIWKMSMPRRLRCLAQLLKLPLYVFGIVLKNKSGAFILIDQGPIR